MVRRGAVPSCHASAAALGALLGAWSSGTAVGRPGGVEIAVPDFVDCTGPGHGGWARFRELLWEARGGSDAREPELVREALRLDGEWRGHLARGSEDYPPGAAAFYHACHWRENSTYCLYGHVAVLTYLAKHLAGEQQQAMARAAMRLLHWNHCLDFLESSSWGISVLDLWDLVAGFNYPQVTMLHLSMEFGLPLGEAPSHRQHEPTAPEGKLTCWVFEFGMHRALSNEPLSMLRRALPDYDVVHQNFYARPYEGRAEAFVHPFPRHCSPNCPHQQDSVPYTFPVIESLEDSRRDWQRLFLGSYVSKPVIRHSSVVLCTNPIYMCSFFAGLNISIFGYFGLPLLYMVPQAMWDTWIREFIDLAALPNSLFIANNPLLAEQIAWQSGVRIQVLRPLAIYIGETYFPSRPSDVLVPEPREACVLHCLLHAFRPADYPINFYSKAETDRTYKTFATFRAVVLFPHDVALMTFYEFYAMGMPLFMPSHLSKYLFPYSASVPMLDWVPKWVHGGGERAAHSPLSLTSTAALAHWSRFMDFFLLPAVQLFPSLPALLLALPGAELRGVSLAMRADHLRRLAEAADFWAGAAASALPSSGAAARRAG